MEIEHIQKRPKFERTTQEQLQFYIQFCKEHPELQAGKNGPCSPRMVQNLWSELADQLNAMRGPTRTVDKWRDTLGQWKNQLRCRARKAEVQVQLTGGGPHTADISEFEQQALQTFGAAAVYGVAGVGSLGHDQPTANNLPAVVNEETLGAQLVEEVIAPSATNESAAVFVEEARPPRGSRRTKSSEVGCLVKEAIDMMKVREEREVVHSSLLLETLQQLNRSVVAMAKAVENLAKKLE